MRYSRKKEVMSSVGIIAGTFLTGLCALAVLKLVSIFPVMPEFFGTVGLALGCAMAAGGYHQYKQEQKNKELDRLRADGEARIAQMLGIPPSSP